MFSKEHGVTCAMSYLGTLALDARKDLGWDFQIPAAIVSWLYHLHTLLSFRFFQLLDDMVL